MVTGWGLGGFPREIFVPEEASEEGEAWGGHGPTTILQNEIVFQKIFCYGS